MKKFISVLFCVALVAIMLAGCFAVPDDPVPIPDPVPEECIGVCAEVSNIVWDDTGKVCCEIKNVGTFDTLAFTVIFKVVFAGGGVEEIEVCVGDGLEIGEILEVCTYAEDCAGNFITDVTVTHTI